MPKYSDENNRLLTSDLYFDILEKKGVKSLKLRRTMDFSSLNDIEIELAQQNHVWGITDNLFKISLNYYGTGNYWWVIGLVNKKPTDAHWSVGDEALIPLFPGIFEELLK